MNNSIQVAYKKEKEISGALRPGSKQFVDINNIDINQYWRTHSMSVECLNGNKSS
jgi:hypothetical protein